MLPYMNVTCETYDENQQLVSIQSSHNIVLTSGRNFLAQVLANAALPTVTPEEPGSFSGRQAFTDACVAYLAVGIGGQYNYWGTSFNNLQSNLVYNAQQVSVDVKGLEAPIPFAVESSWNAGAGAYRWLTLLEANTSSDFPDQRTLQFRTYLRPDEIVYETTTTYVAHSTTAAYITELLLLTSKADPAKPPTNNIDTTDDYYYMPILNSTGNPDGVHKTQVGYVGDVTGAIAYNLAMPIVKYSNNTIKITWQFRW